MESDTNGGNSPCSSSHLDVDCTVLVYMMMMMTMMMILAIMLYLTEHHLFNFLLGKVKKEKKKTLVALKVQSSQ